MPNITPDLAELKMYEKQMPNIGRHVGGLAAFALGALVLYWGDFSSPIYQVPMELPARAWLTYAVALVLTLAGAGVFFRRTAKAAILVLAALFAAESLVKVWGIVTNPDDFHSWTTFAEQSSILFGYLGVFAGLMRRESINAQRLAMAARVWWGCCAIVFGAAHFVYLKRCASFLPQWIPGAAPWSVATGFAHMAAGVGVLTGIWALLAARLATAMYVVFGLVVWGNILAAHPLEYGSWSGLALDFTLVAGAWMIADTVKIFQPTDGKIFEP